MYECVLRGDRTTFWAFCAHRQLATHHAYRTGEMNAAIRHMEAAWRLMQSPGEAGNLIYFHSGAGRPDRGLELYEENRENLHQPRVHASAGMGYLLAGKSGGGRGRLPPGPGRGRQTMTSRRRSTSTWRASRTRRVGPEGWTFTCAAASPWTWGAAANWRARRAAPSGAVGRGGSPSRFRRWEWSAPG